jgi:hypothetical protein
MSDLRKAAEMALKALEKMSPDTDTLVEVEPHIWEYRGGLVIQALRQALTPEVTPEVTPEGWVKIDEVRKYFDSVGCGTIYKTAGEDRVPLYLAPPKKEWVGLTDEELGKTVLANLNETLWTLTKDIEAKLKEKNT